MKVIHTFSLESASVNDVGKYTIKAKNSSGEAIEHFDLLIQSIFFINYLKIEIDYLN